MSPSTSAFGARFWFRLLFTVKVLSLTIIFTACGLVLLVAVGAICVPDTVWAETASEMAADSIARAARWPTRAEPAVVQPDKNKHDNLLYYPVPMEAEHERQHRAGHFIVLIRELWLGCLVFAWMATAKVGRALRALVSSALRRAP